MTLGLELASEPEPANAFELLRRVALRSGVFGVRFTLVTIATYAVLKGPGDVEAIAFPRTFFLAAVAVAPLAAVELAAARWPRSLRRDVLAGLAAFAAAGLNLALLRAVFSPNFVDHGSVDAAVTMLEEKFDTLGFRKHELFVFVGGDRWIVGGVFAVAVGLPLASALGDLVEARLERARDAHA